MSTYVWWCNRGIKSPLIQYSCRNLLNPSLWLRSHETILWSKVLNISFWCQCGGPKVADLHWSPAAVLHWLSESIKRKRKIERLSFLMGLLPLNNLFLQYFYIYFQLPLLLTLKTDHRVAWPLRDLDLSKQYEGKSTFQVHCSLQSRLCMTPHARALKALHGSRSKLSFFLSSPW